MRRKKLCCRDFLIKLIFGRLLGIYDRNQACPLWKRQKRPYRVGFIRRGKTVDTIKQKHPLNLTRYADKLCSCFAISDGLLPTNLVGHVCSAQLSDHVDQLGISPGSHRRRRPGRKRPYRGGRRQQGRTMPVIVTDRSRPRTRHPLCTSTHDSVRPPTDKCSTAYGVSYSNLIKGKAKSKVMLQLMHSMCKSYSKTVVYFIHAPSVLRKKAN